MPPLLRVLCCVVVRKPKYHPTIEKSSGVTGDAQQSSFFVFVVVSSEKESPKTLTSTFFWHECLPYSIGVGRASRGRREVAILPATADPQRYYCQVEGCLDMAVSVDASSPAVLCEGHIRDGMQRIEHNDRIYGRTR